MYSEVNVAVQDGNLGKNTSTGTGVQVKIGVSSVESSVPILITNTMKVDAIKEKLGSSPLADACIDATENGLTTIYAIPVAATTQGTISEITHTGTGEGTFVTIGNPTNTFDAIIEITGSGNTNAAIFRYSIDGGNTYSDEVTVPLSGEYTLPDTGVKLKFTDKADATDSFIAKDTYKFTTTSPAMSNASVLSAVDKLKTFNVQFEICHIVGVSGKALWAALATVADELTTIYKKPCTFVCEGRSKTSSETIDEYVTAMQDERKGIKNYNIAVVLTYGTYQRKDLRTQDINVCGILTGLWGSAKESLSIGYVKEYPISCAKLTKLIPEGIEEYGKVLDEAGYIVLRQYAGLNDFYVSSANMLAPDGSDFPYMESVRVLNRIIRGVSQQATMNIQAEIDPNDVEGSVKAIESELNIPVEQCITDKVISSGEVTIDTATNILVDEELNVSVEWVPMGTARKFNITFAVNNPYGSSGE